VKHLGKEQLVEELVAAGHALYRAGLVTAFGHVSCRTSDGRLLITPPMPLGRLAAESEWTRLDPDADVLPAGVPREAWIHVAIGRRRPDVGAICRAQPPVATALASAGVPIMALHGQGAFVGPQVPVFDDAVLVRDQSRAEALAERLGQTPALLMRGNGAVTVGADVGEAVARMWVLEASAQMNSVAAAAGTPTPLSDDEQAAWRAVAAEILGRIWRDLRCPAPRATATQTNEEHL
jgi:HCOMODA/2-hydroxy-3-carboxy-muconic semialdehyde decarboxylase